MNQRFEDTYDKATDAICGMAKDYRLLEEKHRQLADRFVHLEDVRDDLRNKLSDALIRCEHPEYHEAKFSLSPAMVKPGGFCDWLESERTVEHEESDIDLAIGMDGESFNVLAFPTQYDRYFDVLMWRWVFNTVRL